MGVDESAQKVEQGWVGDFPSRSEPNPPEIDPLRQTPSSGNQLGVVTNYTSSKNVPRWVGCGRCKRKPFLLTRPDKHLI